MQNYHNVSVRLQENDYKQLLYLHEKFNTGRIGKISLADVLRLAIKDLYIAELREEQAMKDEVTREVTVKEPVEELKTDDQRKEEFIQQLEAVQEKYVTPNYTDDIKQYQTEITEQQKKVKELVLNSLEDEQTMPEPVNIESQLEQYEKELREAKNSKNKPYSETHISKQLEAKRKELETSE